MKTEDSRQKIDEKSTEDAGRRRAVAIATGIGVVLVLGAVVLGGRLIGGAAEDPAVVAATQAPSPSSVPAAPLPGQVPSTIQPNDRAKKNMWDPNNPPGPNYVWSKEHGHWHNATPEQVARSKAIPIKVEPPPEGKVWSEELQQFVTPKDAKDAQTSPQPPPAP